MLAILFRKHVIVEQLANSKTGLLTNGAAVKDADLYYYKMHLNPQTDDNQRFSLAM